MSQAGGGEGAPLMLHDLPDGLLFRVFELLGGVKERCAALAAIPPCSKALAHAQFRCSARLQGCLEHMAVAA